MVLFDGEEQQRLAQYSRFTMGSCYRHKRWANQ